MIGSLIECDEHGTIFSLSQDAGFVGFPRL
jgi:hypothetical protein